MATYDLAYPGAAIDAILNTAYFLQEAGYIFQGSASEYSGTPSKRVWLIAPAGSTGFGLSSAVPQGSIGICLYNGTSWVGKIINVATIDSTPTQNSGNAVSSGGAYAAINQLSASVTEALENLTFTDTTPSAFQDEYINMKVSTTEGGVERILTYLTILAATTSKAGLLSAADKVKIDSFLTNLRSLTFADTTASADQATQITETLKATIGGVQEVIDSITLLAATSSKAGLLSASDKAYIDALPATLTNLSNSISGALALMQSLVGYYVCDTAAGTAAKTVDATGYSLTNGGCIRIKMTNANTAANVTLNINSTGAKALYYDGTQASSTNTWEAGEVLEVYYDGTQYQCASGGGGKFATGEKVKETSITNEISANNNGLPKSSAVYNALAPLRYSTYNDITSLAVQQSSGTQTQVCYNNRGNLTITGYGSAYKLVLPEGTTKVKVSNALNSPYNARLVMFNGDTVVQVYKQADLTNEPFTITIPNNVNAIGINRDTRQPMFTVEQVDNHVGLDGALLKPSSVTIQKLADDVLASLMTNDSEKNKMLLSLNDSEYPLRETILQYAVADYNTEFPTITTVWGHEKYDDPVEVLGLRIYEVAARTVTIFVYDTATLTKTVEKSVSLAIGENIVYFDQPHVLKSTEYVGLTGRIAGDFDNNEKQIGNYMLNLQTGVLTPNKRSMYGFTVIYRSRGNGERTSVLYMKDYTKESNDGDFIETTSGTIVEGSTGITLAGNNPIYLNRMYASNKTIRLLCTLYSTTVLKLGYRNEKTSQVKYDATIDCANGKISVDATESDFTVVNGGKYIVDLIKDDYIATLRVSGYKSADAVEVSRWNYTQNDYPVICLSAGTSPIIEAYSIYSGTNEPYIIFFGDSITDGAQTPMYNGRFLARFGDMIGRKLGKPYLVSGRAGSTITYITDEIYGRLFSEAKILRPKYAFVTIGTNGGNTVENLTTLVKKLTDYGSTVILNNVPNRTYNGSEVDIAPTNELLQQIRDTFGLEGVKNEYACSVNNDGVTTDTGMFGVAQAGYVIHPNGEGHYQMFLRTFIDCPDIYTNAGIYPVPDAVPSGTTSERPDDAKLGDIYMDTTLGYHIWSNGDGGWVDKDGNSR